MENSPQVAVREQLLATVRNLEAMAADAALVEMVATVAGKCCEALRRGNKVLFAGNGGSAADAQHLAGELVSRFAYDRPGLAAFALTTDTSVLTAIGNDYGYEHLFARQVQAVGVAGDVFFGISTSGRSPNILAAMRVAREKGLVTVGLTGRLGGQMSDLCDLLLRVPSDSTPRIQEGHIAMGHAICQIIEATIFPESLKGNARSMEAIILAGGLGTRLRSVVADLPKAMAPVAGRPFLEHLLDFLVDAGFASAVLAVGYRADAIREHFGDRYRGLPLAYSVEGQPLGTGGAIRLAMNQASSPEDLCRQRRHVRRRRLFCDARSASRRNRETDDRGARGPRCGALRCPRHRRRSRARLLREGARGPGVDQRRCLPSCSDVARRRSAADRLLLRVGLPRAQRRGIAAARVPDRGLVHRHRRARGLRPRAVVAGHASVRVLSSEGPTVRAALFLDRDGVINVDRHYVWRIEDFEFVPGIFELVEAAVQGGLLPIVVTNQAGIGRGYYTEGDFRRLDDWMHAQFRERGAAIARTYHCPYHPTEGIGDYRRESFDRNPIPA